MKGAPAGSVEGRIHGNVSARSPWANNILQNNVSHGGIVYVAAPGQTPTVRRRPSPVRLTGWARPPLLGRDREIRAAWRRRCGSAAWRMTDEQTDAATREIVVPDAADRLSEETARHCCVD
jgi:hypothetical protein